MALYFVARNYRVNVAEPFSEICLAVETVPVPTFIQAGLALTMCDAALPICAAALRARGSDAEAFTLETVHFQCIKDNEALAARGAESATDMKEVVYPHLATCARTLVLILPDVRPFANAVPQLPFILHSLTKQSTANAGWFVPPYLRSVIC